MSLQERLESLYDIYHPEQKDSFGSIVDYDGNGFSFHSMQLMKLTTKDLVATTDYDDSQSTYIKIGNTYARGLFINSIPVNVPDTVLVDIMSVSSNSILSVLYQPMESGVGFVETESHRFINYLFLYEILLRVLICRKMLCVIEVL